MPVLALHLLGPPRIERDGRPIVVDRQKAVALLAYLAVSGERHRRDALVELLWPDSDPSHGHGDLRSTLSILKIALAGDWLDIDRQSVRLRPGSDIWLDIDRVHSLLAESHAHCGNSLACPSCLNLLAQAVDLARGDFLSGFSLKDSADFDDWQFSQSEALRRELSAALQGLVEGHVAQQSYDAALSYAQRWLALDRLNEPAHAQVMRLYVWSGRRTAALQQYQACAALLQQQLGVEPDNELTALFASIRDGRQPPKPALRLIPPSRAAQASSIAPTYAEQRAVTVLCALAAHGAPAPQTASFLTGATDIVAAHGGDLLNGEAGHLLAAFGLSHTHETDPELAIRAGLALRAEADRSGLAVRLGVSSGHVRVAAATGGLSHPARLRGLVFDVAARLAALAQSGEILVSETTYHETRRAFQFTPSLVDAPGRAFAAMGLLARPEKTRGIEGLRAELTGRDEELTKLKAALALATRGSGQLVTLVAEAGAGKSRLLSELKEAAASTSGLLLWLEGRCLDVGTPAGYGPFLDILRSYFAWTAEDGDRSRRAAVARCLAAMVERGDMSPQRASDLAALLGRLLSLASGGEAETDPAQLQPAELRFQTFLALRDFFYALARRQPLVLVFEDLHWADNLSLDLISLLMEGLSEAPLLLLCAYRPGREHPTRRLAEIGGQKCAERFWELRLRQLSRPQSAQLVTSLLADCELPDSVLGFILDRAQGNPFFIEETVRSLIDNGVVYQEGGCWRAQAAVDDATVPDSVQSVVLSRVDRLDAEARDVLQAASVIGRLFRSRLLEQSLPQAAGLEDALERLEDRGLIYQERAVPELEYSFNHVLTQQTVYHSLAAGRRQELHQQVAAALEALYRDRLGEYCEQLAYHHDGAGHAVTAIDYYVQAGEKAKLQFANDTAIAQLSRALDLLRMLPASRERHVRELDLLLRLGIPVAASKGMSSPDMLLVYGRARDLCRQLGAGNETLPALHGLFRYYHTRGQWPEANDIAEQMMSTAQAQRNPILLLDAYRAVGIASFYTPDLASCVKHMERGAALRHELGYTPDYSQALHDPAISYLSYGAWALWLLGYADQAQQMSRRLLDFAGSLASPADLAFALYQSGFLHHLRGEVAAAAEQAGETTRISLQRGYPMWLAFGIVLEGWALAERGETAAAIAKLRAGIDRFRAIDHQLQRTQFLAWLAAAHGRAQQPQEGLRVLDEAFAIIAAGGERTFEAELYRVQGELLLLQASYTDAEACFQRALEIARSQSAKAWELRAATSLARLWLQQGKRDEAHDLLHGVYGWFTEGFDTADLQDAKALLSDLA